MYTDIFGVKFPLCAFPQGENFIPLGKGMTVLTRSDTNLKGVNFKPNYCHGLSNANSITKPGAHLLHTTTDSSISTADTLLNIID